MDDDPRPRPPEWSQVIDLVEGARKRGFTDSQLDYLRAVMGVCWAKAEAHGAEKERRAAAESTEGDADSAGARL